MLPRVHLLLEAQRRHALVVRAHQVIVVLHTRLMHRQKTARRHTQSENRKPRMALWITTPDKNVGGQSSIPV